MKMLKIGHRGAKGYAPENTLVSFKKAIDLGVEGVELDVHLTADNHLICIHDETLDRTTSGVGFVYHHTLHDLKQLRIENIHEIPTLSEVIDLIDKQIFINIELKGKNTAKPVAALIKQYILEKKWTPNHFLISSFDWNALREMRTLDSEISIGVLTTENLSAALDIAKSVQAKSIHPFFRMLTLEDTKEMQSLGFEVFPWTVNEPADIEKIKSFGVNGIISDFPNKL